MVDGTTSIPYGTPVAIGVPSASSFDNSGTSYTGHQLSGRQQVADLLQLHAISREERHRQIAAAAAALSNESMLLPSVGSSDSANTQHTTSSRNMAVDDRLSGSASSSLTGVGISTQHQDRALQHLNHQSASVQTPTLTQSQPTSSSSPSNQGRRQSNQMLALLAATEQERRGEDLSLLLSFDQQNKGGDDELSKKQAPAV